jgi:hypothetical protein
MNKLKNIWKYSKLRFYIKNAKFNLIFWLTCKKQYKSITFYKNSMLPIDSVFKEQVNKKRFEGYLFKGKIYLDNPGLTNIENDTWAELNKKGVI